MPRTKKKGRRSGRGGKRSVKADEWVKRDEEIDMHNAAFESYYKAQKIIPNDEEWDQMLDSLRQPLPSTFRISTHKSTATSLNNIIKNTFVPELEKSTFDGDALPVPKSLPWFPDGLAWQISLPRKFLRKAPEYKRFHNFLVYESEAGNIARQEAVSMVPPLFLDVKPNHHVLDMCAAPGSKTAQILEALQPLASEIDSKPSSTLQESLLVANDSDHKRAQLLVHTTARRACPGLMVTSVDASIFPAIFRGREGSEDTTEQVRFDRILADVPCSGDGTMRKNVGIWNTWSAKEGSGLHSLQLRILQRAMALLKEGKQNENTDRPRIVYSTCSLNPMENEAVIAAALKRNPGYELVDVSDHLVELKRRPGLTSWRPPFVKSKDEIIYFDSYEEYLRESENIGETDKTNNADVDPDPEEGKKRGKLPRKGPSGQERRKPVLESMWPPSNIGELNLERCMRFYPHLQDTGGFFVAVLQRKRTEPVTDSSKSAGDAKLEGGVDDSSSGSTSKNADAVKRPSSVREEDADAPTTKKARVGDPSTIASSDTQKTPKPRGTQKSISANGGGTYKENPFTFIDPVETGLSASLDRLNLQPHFPVSNLFIRNPPGSPIRFLYLANNTVKSIIQHTEPARVRLISAGVKVLGKSDLPRKAMTTDAECAETIDSAQPNTDESGDQTLQFRITNEGLHSVLPFFIRERLLKGDESSLQTLLKAYYPLCSEFEDPFKGVIEPIAPGSQIICFPPGVYGKSQLVHDLYLPLWKSGVSVSMMVDKQTKSAISLQLFGKDVTVAGKQQAAAKQSKTAQADADVEMDSQNSRSPSPQPEGEN